MKTKEEIAAKRSAYYFKNKEKLAAKQKVYYLKNKEKIIANQKDYHREYVIKNREKINKYNRDRYTSKRSVEKREYYLKNKKLKEEQKALINERISTIRFNMCFFNGIERPDKVKEGRALIKKLEKERDNIK